VTNEGKEEKKNEKGKTSVSVRPPGAPPDPGYRGGGDKNTRRDAREEKRRGENVFHPRER
jgi:hypothetical protein